MAIKCSYEPAQAVARVKVPHVNVEKLNNILGDMILSRFAQIGSKTTYLAVSRANTTTMIHLRGIDYTDDGTVF